MCEVLRMYYGISSRVGGAEKKNTLRVGVQSDWPETFPTQTWYMTLCKSSPPVSHSKLPSPKVSIVSLQIGSHGLVFSCSEGARGTSIDWRKPRANSWIAIADDVIPARHRSPSWPDEAQHQDRITHPPIQEAICRLGSTEEA